MLNRTHRSSISRVVLALMLFAQAAMAWSACELPERAPELALRAAAGSSGCEAMTAAQGGNSSVCLAHCLSEKQSLYKAALDIPAMPAAPVRIVAEAIERLSGRGNTPAAIPAAGTGPPRRILLQSFQI